MAGRLQLVGVVEGVGLDRDLHEVALRCARSGWDRRGQPGAQVGGLGRWGVGANSRPSETKRESSGAGGHARGPRGNLRVPGAVSTP